MRILLIFYLINQPSVIKASVLLKRITVSAFNECLGLFLSIWSRQIIIVKRKYQGYTHGTGCYHRGHTHRTGCYHRGSDTHRTRCYHRGYAHRTVCYHRQ